MNTYLEENFVVFDLFGYRSIVLQFLLTLDHLICTYKLKIQIFVS